MRKHSKTIHISLALTILVMSLFTGCGSEKPDGYETYENDIHNFSINYPQDWNVKPKNLNRNIGPIVVFQPSTEDSLLAHVTVFTQELPDSVNNVTKYFAYSRRMLLSRAVNLNIIEKEAGKINGQETYHVQFSYVRRKHNTMAQTYMFIIEGKGYVVSSVTNTELFDKFKPTFEKISRSIKFD